MKTLEDQTMDSLRSVAHDLEALLDEEVPTPRKKRDLVANVRLGLLSLADKDRDALDELLERSGIDLELPPEDDDDEAAGSTETASSYDADEDAQGDDEGGEEAATVATEPKSAPSNPPIDPKTLPGGELPYAIQIRSHTFPGKSYGAIIVNPTAEQCSKGAFRSLNEDGVRKLGARGSRIYRQ